MKKNPFIKLKWKLKVYKSATYRPWFSFKSRKLTWRNSFGTPRVIFTPSFSVKVFNLYFVFSKSLPNSLKCYSLDQYYEQYIWWSYFNYKDIKEAEITWAWFNFESASTWVSKFVK